MGIARGNTIRKPKVTDSDSGGRLEHLIAHNIKQIRLQRRMNQTELAKACKTKPAAISMIEGGKRAPSYDMLERIAKALKVTPDQLLIDTLK